MVCISLHSILNAIIGITSYYCVILKITKLLDAIKTIQNKFFSFSLKIEQNLVSFQKNGFFSTLPGTEVNAWYGMQHL